MSNYCFYTDDALELAERANLKSVIDDYATSNKKQTYVLCRPLSKDDSSYDYDNAIVIFSAGIKPCFVNINGDEDDFEEFTDDFLEDVAYLSEKFKYRDKIGRKKKWEDLFVSADVTDFDFSSLSLDRKEARTVDLIISLIVGSINDVTRVDLDADNILDSVKSKIILFDTDQTSFVFKSGLEKKFVIQGLAGSGKTELLLHKLKEVYSKNADAKIAFTCFNKILASTMKNRIPNFFDFMRVERQIDWGNKLFCFHSWGSGRDPNSGMYRYICHYYGIPFGTFSSGSFESLCQKAIDEIKGKKWDSKKAFDYVFVDESQDFPQAFLDLCELVTEKKVFIAGDVFQNIFRPIADNVNRADMVLKKCYRTDPKNLMFSHALGMGLYEYPVLRWLKESEWDACGYNYVEEDGRVHLSRDPLRRFEDIPQNFKSTSLHMINDGVDLSEKIISIINELKSRHSTLTQGDVAVIFLDTGKYIYNEISNLVLKVKTDLGWDSNVSFESKSRQADKFFISNINNAKGLEFPFVICFAKSLTRHASFRNALYTMMARSFLESHLILSEASDSEVIRNINQGLDFLTDNNYMDVRYPTQEEIDKQNDFIILDETISLEKLVKDYCTEHGSTPRLVAKIISRISPFIAEVDDYDEDYLLGLIELEYQRNKTL
ncbi:AAA family ATPase [Salmonella enterica subsp. salamae]|uniref:DNA helicase n=2 Tax=Salmonella enterica subsp. salamae TaxID=59202 RepID=A0A701QQI7_SALER|nr:DNA helicase [Salmonella enterica]ECW5365207.1 AAA family ATPase [Salmonella enterica subsp. salamae]HAC6411054.1 DNA helicase [Salmonella enterica subsp. salamae serovar 58:a:-]HAE8253830.1 AAA family ATPase [Salmonella enterica subsp. salamae serovar 42:b:1,5]HCM1868177.1 DEAD/DEAH box helicase [Salmonella enterica subsp. salamae serovar 58:a:z6]